MVLAKDIIQVIERFAPPVYQESYDNSGLQVGDTQTPISGVLLALDFTEAVLEEAVSRGCNMIVAHHPIIFSGLKRLTGRTYVERIVQQAVKKDLVLYAAHTNLDNIRDGVNARIADRLGLRDVSILSMKTGTLSKLYTYAPQNVADQVRDALFAAGAGAIGSYRECSFNGNGTGTFRPGAGTDPHIGKAGGDREWVEEVKIEVLVQQHQKPAVLQALVQNHPYEEVAYEFIALQNVNQQLGSGMVGFLPEAMEGRQFLAYLKERMQTTCIRHTALPDCPVRKIAVCGGSGSFLLKEALGAGADVFVTADYKYHQFFDAEGRIVIADIGHFESEQFTVDLFGDLLREQLPGLNALPAATVTNPVHYFVG